jgi:Tol biopolymer transport system component
VKPVRGGLLLAVVVIAAMVVIPTTAWATYPGANGLIAYSELGERLAVCNNTAIDNWEILTISPAGGQPTQLTDNATADEEPSWSANGRRLAFVRTSVEPCRSPNVWTMRADGTHQRQVTHGPAYESSPAFSPGGGRLVMVRNGNIVVIRSDGTERVRLTSGEGARNPVYSPDNPVFSPDGRRIVFEGQARKRSRSGIWSMRRDGTHKRLLADPEDGVFGGFYYHPDFDPDGSRIVFEHCDFAGHTCDTDNILMRSNGRRKHVIRGGEKPVFSPDGTRVAGVRVTCDYYTEVCQSWVISYGPNAHGTQIVTQDRGPRDWVSSPSWQPIPEP